MTDTYGLTASDDVLVSVFGSTKDNFIVNAGVDQNITTQESVTLDGSETYNLEYKIIKYEWTENGTVLGSSPVVWLQSLPLGVHTITLSATDITGVTLSDDVIVRVTNGTDLIADAGKDQYVELGEMVTLDGSNSFDPNGNIVSYVWEEGNTTLSTQATFSTSNFSLGTHTLNLTVTDNDGNVSSDSMRVIVSPVNDTTPPLAVISSPSSNSVVTLQTDIIGTASDKHIAGYRVLISPVGKNDFTLIAESNNSVTDDVLATLDATTLKNGIYDVSLEVTDTSGLSAHASTKVIIDGKAKIGNFSFTVTDFNIQVGGIPVQVNRTYSTLQRFEKLDFTYAWSIDYQNVKLEESIHPGKAWKVTPDVLIGSCFKTDKQHIVNVSLPDGTTESFEFKFEYECRHYFVGSFYEAPILVPLNGTEAKLEVINAPIDSVMVNNKGELFNGRTLELYNPEAYRLTLPNGMVYELSQKHGITKIKDIRGDTLTYNHDGILSSRGESLAFERDSQDRITKITDLAGKSVTYHYNQNDDLDYVIDQLGQKTEYRYQAGHLLEEYFDPSGLRLTKNIYDASGRLIQTIDADGNVVEFTHNIDGKEEIVKDKLGRTSVFVYDDQGNVLSQTNPMGETTTHTYDAKGRELTTTDPLGNTITNSYDTAGNLLSTTDALGHSETTTYNDKQSPTSSSDKNGNTLNIIYNDYNNPRYITTPSGAKTTYWYDKFGNKIESINEYNQTTKYTYKNRFISYIGDVSSTGKVASETRPDGTKITYTYDESLNLLTTTTTTAEGTTTSTSNTYDAFNRVVSTTDELNNTTTYEYDTRGNKVSTTDGQNRTTRYTYNNHNKLTKTTYPDGTTESKTYDAMDNLLSETNQEGEITSYEYDGADRLIKTTYADGSTTSSEYDAAGRVISTTDQRGNSTTYEYDAVGNKISTTDALGNKTTYTYDAEGNMLSVTDALGHTMAYTYDATNNRILTTYDDGTTESSTYDISGNKTSHTNQKGITTTYKYDTYNRLIEVTDALGQKTTFTYDSRGDKLTQTDALGRTTSWEYDRYGNEISRILPLGQTQTVSYDAQGRVASRTDFNGQVSTYSYDINDRITGINYADGSLDTFAYDAQGRTKSVSVTDPQGNVSTTTYAYDVLGRLTLETQPTGATLAYSYDSAGNLLTLTVTNALGEISTTTYTYDALNRLKTVTANTGEVTSYSYDAVGNQTEVIHSNGTKALYSYNTLNRLTNIVHQDSQDTTLASFSYTLSPTGERTQITELAKTTTYTYDNLGRLTNEVIVDSKNGDYTASYSYDAVSNRVQSIIDGVTTQYTYDDNDRLTKQGGTTYTYDDNGNTLTQTLDGETTTYTYNSKNQLIEQISPTQTIRYTYDSNGIRTSKTVNDITTQYLVDSNQPYAQVLQESENDTLTVSYTYGSDLLSQTRDNKTTTYHYDGLGSARYLSDSTGAFTDSYDYEAFGKLLNKEGNTTNHYLYTGEQQDEESKQYYLRARYYAPTTGRFTQMDSYQGSQADPVSLHKYLYANANPVMFTDPTGHFSMLDHTMAMGIANTLREGQITGWTKSVEILLGLINGVKYDSVTDFVSLPALAGTAVGLRLMMRFSPKLQKACKNSFDGQTLVATEKGLVPIEDIKIGDRVWAYNETNQTKSLQEVTHLIRGEGNKTLTDIKLDSGEVITATANHPFWEVADHNWTEASQLTLDDILFNIQEKNTTISSLKSYSQNAIVYNLTVANDHTYFVGVGRVLGHNAGCVIPGNDTWDHIYNPYVENRRIKGLHHAPAGILPRGVYPYRVFRRKHGFYELGFNMQAVGSQARRQKVTTMFPNSWSPRMVRSTINKAYIRAKQQGSGDMSIPLNDILGDNRYNGISITVHMRGNTQQPFAYPVIGGI